MELASEECRKASFSCHALNACAATGVYRARLYNAGQEREVVQAADFHHQGRPQQEVGVVEDESMDLSLIKPRLYF
jgi:hypothetical protein